MSMFFDTTTLEFGKILNSLQAYACSSFSKEKILDLKILNNSRKIMMMLEEVEEARLIHVKYGMVPFAGLANQNEIIKRIRLKATLSISDFLA